MNLTLVEEIPLRKLDQELAEKLVAQLSPQELKVSWCIVLGYGRRQIASKLKLADKTVDVYLARIKLKLGISVTHAVPLILIMARGYAWPNELL